MAKRFSTIYGAIFVIVGIMGFLDTGLVGEHGFFMTNAAHDWTHILLGVILLWAGQQFGGIDRVVDGLWFALIGSVVTLLVGSVSARLRPELA